MADPFQSFRVHFELTDREIPTIEEIATIYDKEIITERLEQVRDIFIFNCFSGIVDKMRKEEKEGNRLIIRIKCPLVALSAE